MRPLGDARGGSRRADQQHAGFRMVGQVPTQDRLLEGDAGFCRSGMSVHVDESRQEPPAVDGQLGVLGRLLAKDTAANPE